MNPKMRAILSRLPDGGLDVLYGRHAAKVGGLARHTLRLGNLYVGVTADYEPLFLTIHDAESLDPIFTEIDEVLAAGKRPSREQASQLHEICTSLVKQVLVAKATRMADELSNDSEVEFETACAG